MSRIKFFRRPPAVGSGGVAYARCSTAAATIGWARLRSRYRRSVRTDRSGPAMGHRAEWRVATDGGRPEGRDCAHIALLSDSSTLAATSGDGCTGCRSRGWDWVRLRWCLTCGHVGCCDSSRGAHAHGHYVATGHPLVLSVAPDEDWAWCFADEVFLVPVRGPRGAAPER
ncbi:UBP-type zinc finger domain-containing protein [Streptomyces sp. NPDC003952]